ncbi:AAA ATPase domain-containing protein [Synechococcus sp. RS9909]|nr:AAA ATPase domain-containing protein [Synechococcus sp. RS9909]
MTPLPPSELGEQLLIGRERELASLKRKLFNPPKIATIEGLNGVGKTSLVNVAAFKAYRDCLSGWNGPLLIPCNKVFQLDTSKDADDFIDEVLMAVAQTLIDRAKAIQGLCDSIKTGPIDKWLNSPQISGMQGGFSIVGNGANIGESSETNTSSGFERSGFRKEVELWLKQLFPTQNDGGVICVIDNLELLQTSDTVRQLLEKLRDRLLVIPGLRWVLCGALGIVLGTVSSPRLEGFLHTPIEVDGVDNTLSAEIYRSRLTAYAAPESQGVYLPLCLEDFEVLYHILHRNLRSTLGRADNFCQWVAERDLPETLDEKRSVFSEWLHAEASAALNAAQSTLKPRAWEVFSVAVSLGGVFSPSDFQEFEFNSSMALRPHVKDLEDAGLLVSTQDEGDKRRKTIQVTPKGWLVKYAQDEAEKVA